MSTKLEISELIQSLNFIAAELKELNNNIKQENQKMQDNNIPN